MAKAEELFRRYDRQLRYIYNYQIERRVNMILRGYDRSILKEPKPTPVDEILEFHIGKNYGIKLDIQNLKEIFPGEEVLGYLSIHEKKIVIDRGLMEDTSTVGRRRCSFTMGHEAGHADIQVVLFWRKLSEIDLFEDSHLDEGGIIMTRKHSIDVVNEDYLEYPERQANYYAACLLMPRPTVEMALESNGYGKQIIAPGEYIENGEDGLFMFAMDFVRKSYLHDIFEVNVSAMAYRLLKLGLIKTEEGKRG